ncbi:hypothetical protein AMTR_s00012p00261090 [Amborella trichopoda]|uniref:Uncharacterized protein n=1 Tax=Amborella trichopoda TaxID=13333 RepID=W1PDL7_AMBTC|nr:hypothetical protein AMTR_s00012p00261090 [Amborella trichopoda]
MEWQIILWQNVKRPTLSRGPKKWSMRTQKMSVLENVKRPTLSKMSRDPHYAEDKSKKMSAVHHVVLLTTQDCENKIAQKARSIQKKWVKKARRAAGEEEEGTDGLCMP